MTLDLEKIDGSSHILDLLISCEALLDDLDCYTAAHWFDGEVVEGPLVRRYWVTISLLYTKLPDPKMALRLLKHGLQVEFNRMQRATPQAGAGERKAAPTPGEWLVRLSFPRRLLDQKEELDLEEYEDEVKADDVESAKDSGMDNDTTIHADEQAPKPDQDEGMPPKMPPSP